MEKKKENNWSSLWKTEDWVSVWAGFLIIILILFGVTVKLPEFKWTTGGEFNAFIAETLPAVEKLAKASEEKGELALKGAATAFRAAIDAKDRKAVGEAAKKLEAVSKVVKDEGLKKKSATLAKSVSAQAGNLLSKVIAGENLL